MKSFGRLYVDTIKLKHPITPMFEWGWSQETEEPFRESATCLVFWVPLLPIALVAGVWGEPISEEAAYMKAMQVMDTKTEDIREW